MTKKVNINVDNPSLKDLFAAADKFAESGKDLSIDQIAILNLKKVLDAKAQAAGVAAVPVKPSCFICWSGA